MPRSRDAEVDLADLCTAIDTGRRALKPFREARRRIVIRLAGDQWNEETSRVKRPINFLSLYFSIVGKSLISQDPQMLLSTFKKQYAQVVTGTEEWGNREIPKLYLGDVLARTYTDALIGTGITKVALCTPADAEMQGWGTDYGAPYAAHVSLDDFVFDVNARTFEEAAFIGHKSRVMLSTVRDSDIYSRAMRKKATASDLKRYNEQGDEKTGALQRGYQSLETVEAYKYVDLWEIYLVREKLILTMLSQDGMTPAVQDFERGTQHAPYTQQEWTGPSCGPYAFCRFQIIPDQAMGKGPAQDIVDLDHTLNRLFTKLIQQAERQKRLTAYAPRAEEDAKKIRDAADGQLIPVANPDAVKPYDTGGASAENQQFALAVWNFLNKISGNVELMGGLAAQSGTAMQDKLLNVNSGKQVQDMQSEVFRHSSDVMNRLCWFWHHHPEKVMSSYHQFPGLKYPIESKVTPQMRQRVPWEEMSVRVDPFSLTHQSPQEKLAFIQGQLTNVFLPILQLLQQQGVMFDAQKWAEIAGKYGGNPELLKVLKIGDPIQPEANPGSGQASGMPQVGGGNKPNGQYVRRSESSSGGQNAALQQALMGKNPGGARITAGQQR